jgi:hypothetical protein
MKNYVLMSFVALLMVHSTIAQETKAEGIVPITDKKHEVRLGAVKLLAGPIFEGVYEYVQDSNRGFGVAILLNLNSENEYPENYSLTPFYRMYFQTKEDYGAKGFFVEGFTSFFGGKNYLDDYIEDDSGSFNFIEKEENFFDISIGLALGKKWINSAGFVFEIKLGGGRNLLNASEFEAIVKGDFYIGYRF